jgi:predicted small secreted protein
MKKSLVTKKHRFVVLMTSVMLSILSMTSGCNCAYGFGKLLEGTGDMVGGLGQDIRQVAAANKYQDGNGTRIAEERFVSDRK